MKYIGKWPIGVLAIGLSGGITLPTQAQTLDRLPVCYMQLPNQAIVNLAKLCGDPRYQFIKQRSTPERQAQFLKDFYQQIQNYPEGAAIVTEADPDALIGKANLVCQALKTGHHVPPIWPDQSEQPEFRQRADRVEAVVAQIAPHSLCPELAN